MAILFDSILSMASLEKSIELRRHMKLNVFSSFTTTLVSNTPPQATALAVDCFVQEIQGQNTFTTTIRYDSRLGRASQQSYSFPPL